MILFHSCEFLPFDKWAALSKVHLMWCMWRGNSETRNQPESFARELLLKKNKMLFLCPASGALWIWRWLEWGKKAWYFFSILPWVCVELEGNSLTKWWRKWSFNVRQTGQKPQLYLRVCSCVDLIFCLQNTNWWWGISPFSSSWLKKIKQEQKKKYPETHNRTDQSQRAWPVLTWCVATFLHFHVSKAVCCYLCAKGTFDSEIKFKCYSSI